MADLECDVGDQLRFTTTFTNLSGSLANPTTVAVTVVDPVNAATNPSATNDSTGVYHVDVTFTLAGLWSVVTAGTGAVVAVDRKTVYVRQRPY